MNSVTSSQRPEQPPSLLSSLHALLTNVHFMMLALVGGITSGIYNGTLSVRWLKRKTKAGSPCWTLRCNRSASVRTLLLGGALREESLGLLLAHFWESLQISR